MITFAHPSFPCPVCGCHGVEEVIVTDHHTRYGGVDIVMPTATYASCIVCGENTVSARELDRWRRMARYVKLLQKSNTAGNTL